MALSASGRVTTWKEIAAYIGRDARTAKRYEAERRLPVHRLPGDSRSVVYAFRNELDAWLRLEADEGSVSDSARDEQAAVRPRPRLHFLSSSRARAAAGSILALGLIVASFAVAMAPGRKPAASTGTASADARAAYLNGQYAWRQRTAASLQHAVDDFTQAIVRDPGFVDAYVGLADTYDLMPEFGGMTAAQAYPRAAAAARRALELAPQSAAAHRTSGFIKFWWERDVAGAMRDFQAALKLEPQSADGHHWYANALAAIGDSRALPQIEDAQALDPASTSIMTDKVYVLTMLGLYGEAKRALDNVEAISPDFPEAHSQGAWLDRLRSDFPSMLREMRRYAELIDYKDGVATASFGMQALAAGGEAAMWRALVEREEALNLNGKFCCSTLAADELRLGRRRQSLALLQEAADRHEPTVIALGVNPDFATLRNDPDFRRMLAFRRTDALGRSDR